MRLLWQRAMHFGIAICALMMTWHASPADAQTPVPPTSAASGAAIFKEAFEGNFIADANCKDGTCQIPEGWGVWFVPHIDSDAEGINAQPSFVQNKNPRRVKAGAAAQRIYADNQTFTGGIYRIIRDVKPGARLRFSVSGMSWSSNDDSIISARPSRDIKLKIGIDPTGGNNGQAAPLNGLVVWSGDQDAKDTYTQFSVEIEAKSSTVIVYTYATMRDKVKHNEVYWDEALLETITAASAPAPSVSGTPATPSAPTLQPTATPAPQSVGGVKYTVKDGDTVLSIALKFNKSTDDIRRLNRLNGDLISVGQELIIESPTVLPTATPLPILATLPAGVTATPSTGDLCMLAYFDDNGNGRRDGSEDLVPNVGLSVSAGGVLIQNFTTTGADEPICMRSIKNGAYIVAASILPIYQPTTPLNDLLRVQGGNRALFSLGLRRVSDGTQNVSKSTTATTRSLLPENLGIGSIITLALGAALVFAIGAFVLSLITRRRRL